MRTAVVGQIGNSPTELPAPVTAQIRSAIFAGELYCPGTLVNLVMGGLPAIAVWEPLTLDQLMEVLQERLQAWLRDYPTANPAAPPLLDWFITDDDVARFVPPQPVERPAPEPIPLR